MVCQSFGMTSAVVRGSWTTKGVIDWNHASGMLKEHYLSKGHWNASKSVEVVLFLPQEGREAKRGPLCAYHFRVESRKAQ